jgi:hypothetical protein
MVHSFVPPFKRQTPPTFGRTRALDLGQPAGSAIAPKGALWELAVNQVCNGPHAELGGRSRMRSRSGHGGCRR